MKRRTFIFWMTFWSSLLVLNIGVLFLRSMDYLMFGEMWRLGYMLGSFLLLMFILFMLHRNKVKYAS